MDTETTDTEASTSTAKGVGLEGGVAGERLNITVQAKDARIREVQALVAWAEVRRVVRSALGTRVDFCFCLLAPLAKAAYGHLQRERPVLD